MPQIPLKPFWTSPDGHACKIYHGDVVSVLKRLPPRSVHCCVTSPPYWGLRSYLEQGHVNKSLEVGSERTPEEFVAKMVEVFREVRRVLRDDGTLWLNLGDTYLNDSPTRVSGASNFEKKFSGGLIIDGSRRSGNGHSIAKGNLIGIPWRVALALQADGWVLRSDIPWVKRAAMPESVTNRPAKALEYIFMLAKGKGYYYDAEAVRKGAVTGGKPYGFTTVQADAIGKKPSGNQLPENYYKERSDSRNFRNADPWFESVEQPWGVVGIEDEIVGIDATSQRYAGAHFATYPPNLIRPFILAGTSEKGCCGACGCPWRRVIEEWGGERVKEEGRGDRDRSVGRNRNGITGSLDGTPRTRETTGWVPGCECESGVAPCSVLDPFVGSGTTSAVALSCGRRSVGIDLNEEYLRYHAIPRSYEALTSLPEYRYLVKPKQLERVEV